MHSQGGQGTFGTASLRLFIGKGEGRCHSARPSELGCFHLKQENAQNPLEGPRFENLYLHPHLDKFTPPPVFCVFFAVFLLKPHETLRIPRRWVLNILRLSNEGRMPSNNGPWTKLGYDSCPSLLLSSLSQLFCCNQSCLLCLKNIIKLIVAFSAF